MSYMFPCDRGTRSWQWFHRFEARSGEPVCCIYCGALPAGGLKVAITNASEPSTPEYVEIGGTQYNTADLEAGNLVARRPGRAVQEESK